MDRARSSSSSGQALSQLCRMDEFGHRRLHYNRYNQQLELRHNHEDDKKKSTSAQASYNLIPCPLQVNPSLLAIKNLSSDLLGGKVCGQTRTRCLEHPERADRILLVVLVT
jgi:hypothetical protein